MKPPPQETPPTPRRNLYLAGFMGTGKSAVGRYVAHQLGLRYLDSDHEIERVEKRPVRVIFEESGEDYFRRLEREFVEGGHPPEGCIVSLGGGLIMQPGMIERLEEKGVLVCLFASADTILARTSGNRRRPLLNVDDPRGRIFNLLEERMPVYRRAGTGITTENRTIADVGDHVARVYRLATRAKPARKRKHQTG